MVRAVFFDFDHTLYSHTQKDIPQSARDAVKDLQSKGIMCVLATGRHLVELRHFPQAFELGLDGFVTIDGQICLDKDFNVISSSRLEGKLLESLVRLFESKKAHVILIEKDRMYANTPKQSSDATITLIRHSVGEYTGNPLYMGVVYIEPEKEKWLSSLLPGGRLLRWGAPGVDVVPEGRGKPAGIKAFLNYYNIAETDYMVFGDGMNDVDMIKSAPLGIAMGNGADSAKEAADYVTTSVDDDGIRNALLHFGLMV